MIGFIVNPIAGMGGRVGLKGTDGVLDEAIKRGALKIAPDIARRFLSNLRCSPEFITVSGEMGEEFLKEYGFRYEVVYEAGESTSALDTINACEAMLDRVDLIVFVGGDGTARDVTSVVDSKISVIGVPSGVKMYSSCFAISPEKAAELLCVFLDGSCELKEAEVLDIDEESYRRGELSIRLYGHVLMPFVSDMVQSSKRESFGDEEGAKEEIAEYVVENMEPDVLYIIGAGTTTAKIAEKLGERKTLLGVDAYMNGKLVGEDLDEEGILRLLDRARDARIIVSPIGAQGFIFGRGNQQISSEVIKRVGKERIMVIATPQKLRDTPEFHVYTGDEDVDEMLRGYMKVISGYGRYTLKKVS